MPTMPTTTLLNLRKELKTVLKHEDKLLKEYTCLHGNLHSLDRLLRPSSASANAAGATATVIRIPSATAEYFYDTSREELEALRPRIRRLSEKRRELLRQIIEMEKEEKFGRGARDGAEVETEVEAEKEEDGEEHEAQEGTKHEG